MSNRIDSLHANPECEANGVKEEDNCQCFVFTTTVTCNAEYARAGSTHAAVAGHENRADVRSRDVVLSLTMCVRGAHPLEATLASHENANICIFVARYPAPGPQ